MKKLLLLLIVMFMVVLSACNQSEDKAKSEDKPKSEDKQATSTTETKTNDSDDTKQSDKDKTEQSKEDAETSEIVEKQARAKKISDRYVDLAFSYQLDTQYNQYKDIFSKSMYNQLDKTEMNKKQTKNEDETEKDVKDIKIYFNEDENIPTEALFTATYKITNHKEKTIIQHDVTGRINFTEENDKIKIDGSEIIKNEENDNVEED